MIFKSKTTTPETATTLADQARQAIENAPSRPALIAARRKMAELSAQQVKATAEVNELAKECAEGKGNAFSRAKDLLAGKSISYDALTERLGAARRRLQVLEQAMNIQQREIRELYLQWSQEVERSLHIVREPLVQQMADALKDLRAIAAAESQIQEAISVAGVDRTFFGSIHFSPVSPDVAMETGWLEARRAEGYSV